ncbi:Receptor expression-enhancing protein 4 [Habropoda laboriosa]|uniref:Receptor expression-enhancing protein 4 n=1 Tax=Habropoda laboriosa TaxID=597456 RepID=A0A0L7RHL4_9HYME|nr:Receptor expression-enhancing protein 4 [Habropoda laboriosa]
MELKRKEPKPEDLEETPVLWTICKTGVPRILTTSLLAIIRYCADQLPERMTLGWLRILASVLVIVMPRSFTYVLLYPIFRLVFGNLYPAYASYKAVRTKNVKEYVKWMMYWIVFALFTCAETFTDVFFSFWFPFYYEVKTILVIWLLSPATKGSSILYRRFVHPALIRREAEIDEALARATEQGYTAVLHLGSKGVNYATTVLMQTAIKHLLEQDQIVMSELPAVQQASAISSLDKPLPATSTPKRETDQLDSAATTSGYLRNSSSSSEESVLVESVPSLQENLSTVDEGGGGLVQQLKKSYSLSDLTGEKEDENRNTPHMHDETDMEVEPRRREHVGRRGYSPRRTQSSNTRVEMYFSEVDVDVRQPASREPTTSLTNIRSSDDISSGYGSREALQSSRTSQGDSLVRTSSVGAKTRARTARSATKKTPEDSGEDSDSIDPPFSKNISFPTPLSLLTPEQALEFLLLLSQNSNVADYIKFDRDSFVAGNEHLLENTSQSGPELEQIKSKELKDNSSGTVLTAEVQVIQSIETKAVPEQSSTLERSNDSKDTSNSTQIKQSEVEKYEKPEEVIADETSTVSRVTDELCQNKFDELKQLLSNAHKAVNNIVYTQEKFKKSNTSIPETLSEKKEPSENVDTQKDPNVSRSNSDSLGRAGRYNKRPAPKVPIAKSEENLNVTDTQSALKATLVIKTGTLKTFSNTGTTKDVFIAHATEKLKGKKSKRQRTKEGFSKLLTIPKNIFHNAFYREHKSSAKAEDSSSDISADQSRSNSIEPQETIIELAPNSNREANVQNDDKSDNDTSNSSDTYILASNDSEEDKSEIQKEKNVEMNNEEKILATNIKPEIRELSQSPKAVKILESDIF